jgi:putative hydrolase of the HAD superfamily
MGEPGRTCVVLDIGGVLEVTPPTGWLARWEKAVGFAPGTTAPRMADVWAAGAVGALSGAGVVAAAEARLGVSAPQLETFWAELWREYLGTLNVELFDWFRDLRRRHRTGILSNSFVGARERERALYGFEQVTDVIVYSHEVGLSKPDPRIYALTAGRLGAAPCDMVFLDDSRTSVAGARQAGWRAVQFTNTAQAIADVEALLEPTWLREEPTGGASRAEVSRPLVWSRRPGCGRVAGCPKATWSSARRAGWTRRSPARS